MSGKKSLYIDARMYQHSGIGKYLQMLLPYIVKAYDVTLLGDPVMLGHFLSSAKIISFTAPIYSINSQFLFRKLISSADFFWSPHYNVPLLGLGKVKRIVTIHDVFHLAYAGELSFMQRMYAKLVINRAIKVSDLVITVSNFSKSEIVKYTGCAPESINVIHNGMKQVVQHMDFEIVKRKYSLPQHYLLFVGNVKPHKNLANLLKAFLLLSPALQQKFKVVIVGKKDGFIVGDNALINWIEATPELRENVVFTGFVDEEDIDTVYANAAQLVFPSVYEGFGLPPLEAMVNECPVSVSNANSLPEVCGEAALYFDPLNEADISSKISTLLNDRVLSNKIKLKGLERVKLFDWQESAVQHIDLFDRLNK